MIDYDKELNSAQKAAVLYDDGPSLVLAGAGSGKTRVLTYKLAHLIEEGYAPEKLMALTFTNKAAHEMKERVEMLVGGGVAKKMMVGTFHSVFARILRNFAHSLGFTRNFSIYDTDDSLSLIKKIVKDMHLDTKTYVPSMLLARISEAKNRLVSPESYLADDAYFRSDTFYGIPKTGEIFQRYSSLCKKSNAMDFDDLLYQFGVLLRDFPEALDICQDKIDYLLIDEFQDTNIAQYYVTQKLVAKKQKIFAVGDDAQSIYSFRGASIHNILNFNKAFPHYKLFKLEQNYRSTQCIVSLANGLIDKNKSGIKKTLFSKRGDGEKITLRSYDTAREEAVAVVLDIDQQCRKHLDKEFSHFAILYRTNAQSRLFEEQLNAFNIPYRVYGMTAFYSRAEIKNVLAYLRILINPHDDEAFARTLNYPKKGIGDKTQALLRRKALEYGLSLYDTMHRIVLENGHFSSAAKKKIKQYIDLLHTLFTLDTTSLFNKVAAIISLTGIEEQMQEDQSPKGMARWENVKEFLSSVWEFERMQKEELASDIPNSPLQAFDKSLLSSFLERVSLVTTQEVDARNSNHNKVTLMTAHAAKGLEFNDIYITGMEEGVFPSMRSADPLSKEEERRLFYVAITRACNRCTISYSKMRTINGMNELMLPSSFLRDLDPTYLIKKGKRASWELSSFPHALREEENNSIRERSTTLMRNNSNSLDHTMSLADEETSAPNILRTHSPIVDRGRTTSMENLHVGTRIRYSHFGAGTVEEIRKNGDSNEAVIRYDDGSLRTIILKYAKNIEILS